MTKKEDFIVIAPAGMVICSALRRLADTFEKNKRLMRKFRGLLGVFEKEVRVSRKD